MIQPDLIPTTNTLSRFNDSLPQLREAFPKPDIINTMAEQAASGSSSKDIGLTIAIIGLLIFTAHLFGEIFSRNFMLQRGHPKRCYNGNHFQSGYSDHLPVLIKLR